ncbi:MAG: cupin domain-containing protein [Candidatus Lokiarchaeota archaeon]
MKKGPINVKSVEAVEALDGIFRQTLTYNDDVQLCVFTLEKGAKVPMHTHKSHQIGYILEGKVKFITKDKDFIATKGDSYVFDGDEEHGADIINTTKLIEVFSPTREDYK